MTRWLLIIGIGVVLAGALARLGGAVCQDALGKDAGTEAAEQAGTSFAVVELFTSEGCSSCPPADKLFAEVLQDAAKHGRRVIGLAFHVDYWDHLGWKDAYGARAFSLRQQGYSRSLKIAQIYTPQIIVNGAVGFVGSDRRRAREAIDAALKQPAKAQVRLGQRKATAPGLLSLAFEVTGAPQGAVLNVVVVQRGLATEVRQGENAGRKLQHDNVVRVFDTIAIAKGGKGSIDAKLPANLVLKDSSVVAYVQIPDSGVILRASLQPTIADNVAKSTPGPQGDAK